ncbi:hypothetical protein K440DRAFT_539507 [Wilcoxina mikolae CBS 423.85]|nr:hypothetical protein K440DRAFT_539507 [Wilcoxina mikolae CBS 423.85]
MHNNESSSKSRDRERQLRELKEQVRILQRQHDAEEKSQRERARTSAEAAVTKTPGTTTPTTPTTTATTTSDVPVPDPGGLSADGIALRSTLRLLMLQRDRAKRDIHSLEEMREAALKEPLEFVEFIQSQKAAARGRGSRTNSGSDNNNNKKLNIFAGKELPKPQEIYKCPNIEWSQYKILGAPLDALHEKHLRRVPPSMQTGGIIGMPEYGDESGVMQGRLRMFDGLVQRGGVVGR